MTECAFENDFNGECSAMTEKKCQGCKFRKTKEELEEGRKKARERFDALPADLRTYLKQKYNLR